MIYRRALLNNERDGSYKVERGWTIHSVIQGFPDGSLIVLLQKDAAPKQEKRGEKPSLRFEEPT